MADTRLGIALQPLERPGTARPLARGTGRQLYLVDIPFGFHLRNSSVDAFARLRLLRFFVYDAGNWVPYRWLAVLCCPFEADDNLGQHGRCSSSCGHDYDTGSPADPP